jgi:CheY-like chemotaxis protein
MTVLAVDDDPDDLELLVEAITTIDTSIVCVTAANGLEAVNYVRENIPDFILLDINMPVLNGIEALKAIRDIDALQNVPVIMFSTSDSYKEKQIAKSHDAEFFTKPNSYQNWITLLRDQLKSSE